MATEKRLIDANDLWSDIMMLPHNGDMISSEEVEQAIKEAPTVDAVEVVRCRECIYAACNPVKLTYACHHSSGLRGFINEGFYFCPHGERKEEK